MRWVRPWTHSSERSSTIAFDWAHERTRRVDTRWREQVYAVAISLALVGLLTAGLLAFSRVWELQTVTIIYLIPVIVAARRWGIGPALIAAVAGIGVAAFFFYPPIYDFRVYNPEHLADIILFIFVAAITGQLADQSRQAKIRAEAERLREALIDFCLARAQDAACDRRGVGDRAYPSSPRRRQCTVHGARQRRARCG